MQLLESMKEQGKRNWYTLISQHSLTSFVLEVCCPEVLYFFGYKTEFFFFQNNPKDLDPSYKMDLDLLIV